MAKPSCGQTIFLLEVEGVFEGCCVYYEAVRAYTTASAAQQVADAANEYEKTRPQIDWETDETEAKTRRRLERWEKKHPEKETAPSDLWRVREVEIRE